MKKLKVVFFDLYNTLVYIPTDTNPYRQFFKFCDLKSRAELNCAKQIILTEELPTFDLIEKRIGIQCQTNVQDLTRTMNEEISQTLLFDDVLYALKQIKLQGLELCLISNLATPYKKPVYDLGLNNLFDKIIFSCERGCRKPNKEIFFLACQEMSINPKQGLMLGDNVISDYQGALSVGMSSVLLNRKAVKTSTPNIKSLKELFLFS